MSIYLQSRSFRKKKKPSILPEYREMYEKNHDMAGWLKIEGTNVDYPVMHVKGSTRKSRLITEEVYDKNMYYLTHDFDKEYSFRGVLRRIIAHISAVITVHRISCCMVTICQTELFSVM